MIYILKHQGFVFHTQLIKLLYLIDEEAVKDDGIPVTWLDYKAWEFGPVAPETYYMKHRASLFDDYVNKFINDIGENKLILTPKVDFCDDEFSDYEIDVIDSVIKKYQDCDARSLVNVTHESGSLWDQTRIEHQIDFQKQHTTDFSLDFTKLIKDEPLKIGKYQEAKEDMIYSLNLQLF